MRRSLYAKPNAVRRSRGFDGFDTDFDTLRTQPKSFRATQPGAVPTQPKRCLLAVHESEGCEERSNLDDMTVVVANMQVNLGDMEGKKGSIVHWILTQIWI